MRANSHVVRWKHFAGATVVGMALATRVLAGGSGLNVAVVVNQNSPDSIELGNYYCEKRGVPPQNFLRINWAGGNNTWTTSEFDMFLRTPLTAMLASRQLTNQIDVVLLSMDIPYRVTRATGVSAASGVNSTTSSLFYGFHPDGCTNDCPASIPSCNLPPDSANHYAGSEDLFRSSPPLGPTSNSWLAMMLTSSNLTQAKALVDRGLVSDFAMPTQQVFLAKSDDVNRNVRYTLFDNALFNIQLGGVMNAVRANLNTTSGLGTMLGYANGYYAFTIDGSFAPGAMADSLTSYGGLLFENSGHTDALDFLNAGATASYGTVVEPCNYLEKFPSTMNYFYQARGFSIAECYYQSLSNPYQGILVGEPLAAPFALPAHGSWVGLLDGELLAGMTNLSVQFSSDSLMRPVQQVDLFLDGQRLNTVSNLPPRSANALSVTLNGFTASYLVPTNATLNSVTTGLVSQLNAVAYSNSTKVAALAHGDRIELQSLVLNVPGSHVSVATSNTIGSADLLTTFVTASHSIFLDTPAFGFRKHEVAGMVVTNDFLSLTVTQTNNVVTTVSITNQVAGTSLRNFVQSLITAVNSEPVLQVADGVIAEDLVTGITANGDPYAEFNLRARTVGWKAAQIQAQLNGSFSLNPATVGRLEDNLNDLRPRNHLYLTAGLTNLNLTYILNTANHADGYHELTAVAYEGSHVRTQKRISQNVRFQNHTWSATLTPLLGDTNTALEATLQFAVVANSSNITQIEFFTTGGLFATSNNVDSATFAVAGSYLGIGLHPFHALVTRSDGQQYRTATQWIRVVGPEPPLNVSALGPAPTLTWPASAGRAYQVLSATNLTHIFIPRAEVRPTNSIGQWSETNNSAPQRYYRVAAP